MAATEERSARKTSETVVALLSFPRKRESSFIGKQTEERFDMLSTNGVYCY